MKIHTQTPKNIRSVWLVEPDETLATLQRRMVQIDFSNVDFKDIRSSEDASNQLRDPERLPDLLIIANGDLELAKMVCVKFPTVRVAMLSNSPAYLHEQMTSLDNEGLADKVAVYSKVEESFADFKATTAADIIRKKFFQMPVLRPKSIFDHLREAVTLNL